MADRTLRHVVLLRFRADASDAAKQTVHNALTALPGKIPEIQRYQFGDDAGLVEGHADFAIVAEFANEADFETYAKHPDHQAAIAETIRPIVEQRTALQYWID